MNINELRQTIHQEIDHLPEQALDQILQLIQQVGNNETKSAINPLANFIGQVDHGNLAKNIDSELIDASEIKMQEIMNLADIGGSFNFLNNEPDLYTLEDGEPV